jgi:hypothetical protein
VFNRIETIGGNVVMVKPEYGIAHRLQVPYLPDVQGLIIACHGKVDGYSYTLRFLKDSGEICDQSYPELQLIEHNAPRKPLSSDVQRVLKATAEHWDAVDAKNAAKRKSVTKKKRR